MPLRARVRAALPIVLGVVALLALLVRLASIDEPLAVDQGLWAAMARGLARGQALYRDVWDHRPPGTFLVYLGAFSLFGWTPAAINLADILASAATATLLVLILRRTATTTTAMAAAALFLALTMPAWTSREGGIGQRAVSETFFIPLVAWAAWCTVRLARRPSTLTAAGLGLSAGAIVLLKPNAGIYLPALWLWLALYRDRAAGGFRRVVVVSAAAAIVLPALTLGWLWSQGVLMDAYEAVVLVNRRYVGGFEARTFAIAFSKTVWLRAKIDPLWTAGGVGTLVALLELVRRRRIDPAPALAIVWGGASVLVIVSNGSRLYGTYFLQALPPLAMAGAWLLAGRPSPDAGRTTWVRVHQIAALLAAIVMVKVLVTHHYAAKVYSYADAGVQYLSGRMDRDQYLMHFGGYKDEEGYSARANADLASYVRARTTPGDRIYLFTMNADDVYLQADRLSPHRLMRLNFFVPGPILPPRRDYALEGIVDTLEKVRPAYVIFEHLYAPDDLRAWSETYATQPAVARLLASYRLETRIEDFTLYRRME